MLASLFGVPCEPDGWPSEAVFVRLLKMRLFAALAVEALCKGTLPGRLEAIVWRMHFGEPS